MNENEWLFAKRIEKLLERLVEQNDIMMKANADVIEMSKVAIARNEETSATHVRWRQEDRDEWEVRKKELDERFVRNIHRVALPRCSCWVKHQSIECPSNLANEPEKG